MFMLTLKWPLRLCCIRSSGPVPLHRHRVPAEGNKYVYFFGGYHNKLNVCLRHFEQGPFFIDIFTLICQKQNSAKNEGSWSESSCFVQSPKFICRKCKTNLSFYTKVRSKFWKNWGSRNCDLKMTLYGMYNLGSFKN